MNLVDPVQLFNLSILSNPTIESGKNKNLPKCVCALPWGFKARMKYTELNMYIYVYIIIIYIICIYKTLYCICIYVYIEREREKEPNDIAGFATWPPDYITKEVACQHFKLLPVMFDTSETLNGPNLKKVFFSDYPLHGWECPTISGYIAILTDLNVLKDLVCILEDHEFTKLIRKKD